MLYNNDKHIKSIYLGDNEVVTIYKGDVKVWESVVISDGHQ
jgi:thiamine phosphate synthase YjbQ (UPF0047 family)